MTIECDKNLLRWNIIMMYSNLYRKAHSQHFYIYQKERINSMSHAFNSVFIYLFFSRVSVQ